MLRLGRHDFVLVQCTAPRRGQRPSAAVVDTSDAETAEQLTVLLAGTHSAYEAPIPGILRAIGAARLAHSDGMPRGHQLPYQDFVLRSRPGGRS